MSRPTRRTYLRTLSATALVASVGLAGCSSSCPDTDEPTPGTVLTATTQPIGGFDAVPGGSWRFPHGTAGNAGYTGVSSRPDSVEVRWRTELGLADAPEVAGTASAPTAADGGVYVAGAGGVYALDLRTGERLWQTGTVTPTVADTIWEFQPATASPVVGPEGSVYVGATDGVIALDPTDGGVRWRYEQGSDFTTPVVDGETVVAATPEAVVALDTATGDERWRSSVARQAGIEPPALGPDSVAVGVERGTDVLYRASGETRWRTDRGGEFYPVLDDGVVYVGDYDGLAAFDAEAGDERWTFERGGGRGYSPPVLTDEIIYAVEQPGEASWATFALNRTGEEPTPRWCSEIGSGAVTAATDAEALAIAPTARGPGSSQSVIAFSERFGEARWGYRSGGGSRGWVLPPAVLEDAVVITDRQGTVAAIGPGGV